MYYYLVKNIEEDIMDSDFTTGNRTVDRMSRINITGNIIPAAWYKTIRKSTGKPYLNAIVILSDMLYWYRAAEIRDEGSGQLIGFRKRFHSDLGFPRGMPTMLLWSWRNWGWLDGCSEPFASMGSRCLMFCSLI